MNWNDETIEQQLKVKSQSMPRAGAVVRYIAGCITRERERLAKIFERETDQAKIAAAIRDSSDDASVFIWKPPGGQPEA